MDLEGDFSHFHFVFDVGKHLGVELCLGLTELTDLVCHYLLDLGTCLHHFLIGKFVLEFSHRRLLLRKSVLSFNLLPFRLVLLVR